MRTHRFFCIITLITLFISITYSCKKEDDIISDSSAKLNFSTKLITYDTVFTTVSTSTRQLTVYNPYNQKIKISRIKLATNPSYFSLNINGEATNSASNIEIKAKDSLFIFIKANINPTNQNNPMLITDSIIFEVNGNTQDVDLVACGQDAHFIVANQFINGLPPYKIVAGEGESKTWPNDKPYVIYGYAVIDSTASLLINSGCKVYLHKNSGIWVYKGASIKVAGTKNEPVVFQGDRKESWYTDVAGQWDRIWLNEGSVNNEINYAIIKNGFIGIQAETISESMGNKLILTNTVIKNMSGVGVFARNYKIDASNNQISKCGQYAVALTLGGTYNFVHNTISNHWSTTTRATPSVYLSNYQESSNTIFVNNLEVLFANTIVTGNLVNEIEFDKNEAASFNVNFTNCLLKTALNSSFFSNCISNKDPLFKSLSDENYNLTSASPARDAGNPTYGPLFPLDFNEYTRDGIPDIGAFEYNPAPKR